MFFSKFSQYFVINNITNLVTIFFLILLVLSCGSDSAAPSRESQAEVFWPISGTITPDQLSDFFGPRILNGVYDFHRGLDIAMPTGTPVYALMDGTVVRAEQTLPGETLERFGNFLVIGHSNLSDGTSRQTAYLHLDSFAVSLNDSITKGQLIGHVGSSGVGINTEHLHIEYYVGENSGLINHLKTRNPLTILPYTSITPSLQISKTDSVLTIIVTQVSTSVDIVRLVVRPNDGAQRIIDFQTREGMDTSNDDTNPYLNVTVTPTDFSPGNMYYIFKIEYAGDWTNTTNCTVELTNVSEIVTTYSNNW